MRDHRIVLGVGVLLDVEILLNGSVGVRKEGPLGFPQGLKPASFMALTARLKPCPSTKLFMR